MEKNHIFSEGERVERESEGRVCNWVQKQQSQ